MASTTLIDFQTSPAGALTVSITVPLADASIRFRSLVASDVENVCALFADREVMRLYGTGEPRPADQVRKRVMESWIPRWESGDPFSGMAAERLPLDEAADKTVQFIGVGVLGHGDVPGVSEMAALIHTKFQRNGIGLASAMAVKEYAEALIARGYLVEGEPLREIVATTLVDHPASNKIMQKLGMVVKTTNMRFGHRRNVYFLPLKAKSD